MLTPYLILGLAADSSGDEIRRRYLQLVREHPPGRDPERFQQIAQAYESLKDERTRVKTALFGATRYADMEMALMDLVRARSEERKNPNLKTLLAAEGVLGCGGGE